MSPGMRHFLYIVCDIMGIRKAPDGWYPSQRWASRPSKTRYQRSPSAAGSTFTPTSSGTALPVSPSPTAQTLPVCQKSLGTPIKLSHSGCILTPIRRASDGPVRSSGMQLSKHRNRHKTVTTPKKPTQNTHCKLQQAAVGKSEKSLIHKGFIQQFTIRGARQKSLQNSW